MSRKLGGDLRGALSKVNKGKGSLNAHGLPPICASDTSVVLRYTPCLPLRSMLANVRVTIRVPATSANMGPGFDCMGMAVDIWNEVTVTVAEVGCCGAGAAPF